MKKLKSVLLTICLLILMFIIFTVPSLAAENVDITNTYLSSGEITKPEIPYIYQKDSCISLFYEQVPELRKLAEDYQLFWEQNPDASDNYLVTNGVNNFCKRIQIDYRFDENPWASQNGNWDLVDGNSFDTGSDVYYGICFAVSNEHDCMYEDESNKLDRIYQSDLYYYDPNDSMYSYLHPYVKSNGEGSYVLDLEEHTFAIRIRWYVTYEENGTQKTFFSDWSEETSIGKDGIQEEANLPKLEAPVLSDFSLEKDEGDSIYVKYYIDIPDSAYKANRYHFIFDDYFDSYLLEAQVKKGNSEWTDVYTANASWLDSGYRIASGLDSLEIDISDAVQLRARIVCSSFEETPSPWSNIIGTNAEEGMESPKISDGTLIEEPEAPSVMISTKEKCKVCGICPIQPLGICLFIWIAIVIIVIIAIVILIVLANNIKDKKTNNK